MPTISLNRPTDDSNHFTEDQTNNVKKKKLTNYSLSSSNLPTLSLPTSNETNHVNNSAASFAEEDFMRNLTNSSYNTSYNSMSSGGISASSSYNSSLSSCFINSNNDMQKKQSGPADKNHLEKLINSSGMESLMGDNMLNQNMLNQNWDFGNAGENG